MLLRKRTRTAPQYDYGTLVLYAAAFIIMALWILGIFYFFFMSVFMSILLGIATIAVVFRLIRG